MTLDITAIRTRFPALKSGIAFFDGPGGTQTPTPVIEAVAEALAAPLSNRGAVTQGERNADAIVGDARRAMGDLLGVPAEGVVFGRSATQLTYDLARTLARGWGPGDEVVVTRLDHDANIRPWVQAAESAGATVRWADFDPATGEIEPEDIAAVTGDRTRLIALTAASNLLGTRPDTAAVARLAHDRGAHLHLDGVHFAAHALTDLEALGADTFTCSPYKFLGPHLGVLAARPELLHTLHPDKLLPATDRVPERFEHGTLPYELLAGTTAAVDFLAGLAGPGEGGRRARLAASYTALEEREDSLRRRIEEELAAHAAVRVHSRAARRTPTLLVTFDGRDAADAYRFLATRGVAAPAGSFYALEASRHLGLGDGGGLRVGLAPYTGEEDVDRLLDGVRAFLNGKG
ncbi:cysteine desulfurase-like protein [Streptomyces sp. NPDC051940]|uniref:cysteine desulfurase-like protein n=1 Tax=Streptomyces sp. NPDC051940 TaxID=3155675 RepID=UPI003442E6AD